MITFSPNDRSRQFRLLTGIPLGPCGPGPPLTPGSPGWPFNTTTASFFILFFLFIHSFIHSFIQSIILVDKLTEKRQKKVSRRKIFIKLNHPKNTCTGWIAVQELIWKNQTHTHTHAHTHLLSVGSVASG